MDLFAEIRGISYKPLLYRKLEVFELDDLAEAMKKNDSFILKLNNDDKLAVSWWVSAKRTRSYPYARVYETLGFSGKKVTIIPIIKDEGKDGDRDFLQWDTVSLMSLLGIYTMIGYYYEAEKSVRFDHKITNQQYDFEYINEQLCHMLSFQSDALHWNLAQVEKVREIGQKALDAYELISRKTKVELHSRKRAEERLARLSSSRDEFIKYSRSLAEKAQRRERNTRQPKEKLSGTKATITIQNYLGGNYYFTVDEIETKENEIRLIEGKHSKTNAFPSLEDIKDGLLKMLLYVNIEKFVFENRIYCPTAVLKLTVENGFNPENLTSSNKKLLDVLYKEAEVNHFQLVIQ